MSSIIRACGPGSHRFQDLQKDPVEKDFQNSQGLLLCRFRPLQNILFATNNSRSYFGVVDT